MPEFGYAETSGRTNNINSPAASRNHRPRVGVSPGRESVSRGLRQPPIKRFIMHTSIMCGACRRRGGHCAQAAIMAPAAHAHPQARSAEQRHPCGVALPAACRVSEGKLGAFGALSLPGVRNPARCCGATIRGPVTRFAVRAQGAASGAGSRQPASVCSRAPRTRRRRGRRRRSARGLTFAACRVFLAGPARRPSRGQCRSFGPADPLRGC